MFIQFRTVGKQTGYFVSNEQDSQVFYGPFEDEKQAKDWIANHESKSVKKAA